MESGTDSFFIIRNNFAADSLVMLETLLLCLYKRFSKYITRNEWLDHRIHTPQITMESNCSKVVISRHTLTNSM